MREQDSEIERKYRASRESSLDNPSILRNRSKAIRCTRNQRVVQPRLQVITQELTKEMKTDPHCSLLSSFKETGSKRWSRNALTESTFVR
jgi:hypothetical protein